MGIAGKTVERRDELVRGADGRHELGAVQGRYGARLPHQPDTRTTQGQRVARRCRRQRQTVVGATRRVHIHHRNVPGAAEVHVRHRRPEGRSGRAVPEGRAEEREHHVPDDRLPSHRREVPRAHQRHARQRPDTGPVRRRRGRQHHTNHRTRGMCLHARARFETTCARVQTLFIFPVVPGERGRPAGDQGQLLDVLHQQGSIVDQDRVVLLARRQHIESPGQAFPGLGQLHLHQLVLRMARRSVGIRVVPVSEKPNGTTEQT